MLNALSATSHTTCSYMYIACLLVPGLLKSREIILILTCPTCFVDAFGISMTLSELVILYLDSVQHLYYADKSYTGIYPHHLYNASEDQPYLNVHRLHMFQVWSKPPEDSDLRTLVRNMSYFMISLCEPALAHQTRKESSI